MSKQPIIIGKPSNVRVTQDFSATVGGVQRHFTRGQIIYDAFVISVLLEGGRAHVEPYNDPDFVQCPCAESCGVWFSQSENTVDKVAARN